jgi:hypothetical protein
VQDPPKITQIWSFGLKINHLATLINGAQNSLEFALFSKHDLA